MDKNFWEKKNVLITGCSGFVGSWIAGKLIKKKARVIGLDNGFSSHSPLVINGYKDRMCVIDGSVADYSCMEKAFNRHKIHICLHLAAQSLEGNCLQLPLTTFEINTKGTWVVLEAARNCKTLKSIVIASSDKAYGEQKELPYREDQLLLGSSPYDVSKVCAEFLAHSYFQTFGLPVGITRCANIYGGGDFHWSRVIPGTIRSLLLGERPVIRSDGTPVRDYLYVEDAANAYLVLAEAVAGNKKVRGEAFNFSAETPVTILEMVKLLISVSGKEHLKPRVRGKGMSCAEDDRELLSCKKAGKELKWKAKYPLMQGLKKTFSWYEKHSGAFL